MEREQIVLRNPLVYCNLNKLTIDGESKYRGMHFHTETEAVYVEKGSILCDFGDEKLVVSENSVLIVGDSVIHRLCFNGSKAEISYLHIDTSRIIKRLYPDMPTMPFLHDKGLIKHTVISEGSPLYGLCTQLVDELYRREKHFETATTGCLMMFVAYMQRINMLPDIDEIVKNVNYLKVLPSLIYAKENFSKKLYLSEMCQQLGYDKYNFCKLFKKTTGMTFFRYLNELRLRNAEKLLARSDKTVTEIALESGFSTVQYFNRVFVSERGCSPSSYRKMIAKE